MIKLCLKNRTKASTRAQRTAPGQAGTRSPGKVGADRGRIMEGAAGLGKEFGLCSSVVIRAGL